MTRTLAPNYRYQQSLAGRVRTKRGAQAMAVVPLSSIAALLWSFRVAPLVRAPRWPGSRRW